MIIPPYDNVEMWLRGIVHLIDILIKLYLTYNLRWILKQKNFVKIRHLKLLTIIYKLEFFNSISVIILIFLTLLQFLFIYFYV